MDMREQQVAELVAAAARSHTSSSSRRAASWLGEKEHTIKLEPQQAH